MAFLRQGVADSQRIIRGLGRNAATTPFRFVASTRQILDKCGSSIQRNDYRQL
jgi:hypothetical protein